MPTTKRRKWTPSQIRKLGAQTNIEIAAEVLGISRTMAYQLAKTGEFPVPVLRLGRKYIVPVAGLCEALGISIDGSAA